MKKILFAFAVMLGVATMAQSTWGVYLETSDAIVAKDYAKALAILKADEKGSKEGGYYKFVEALAAGQKPEIKGELAARAIGYAVCEGVDNGYTRDEVRNWYKNATTSINTIPLLIRKGLFTPAEAFAIVDAGKGWVSVSTYFVLRNLAKNTTSDALGYCKGIVEARKVKAAEVKTIVDELNKLPTIDIEKYKAMLQFINRRYSSMLLDDKTKADWEPVIALVRTTLSTL